MLEAGSPERASDVGVSWALEQTRELLDRGVPSVHFYVMQNTHPFVAMMELLQLAA
jgi:methylenetetrahydrofolate reductase (NADH)